VKNQIAVITVWYKSEEVVKDLLEGWRVSMANCQPFLSLHVSANTRHEELEREVRSWSFWQSGAVSVRNPKENIGFAAACNEMSKVADAEWLLFLNPDVELKSDSLQRILKCSQIMDSANQSVGAISLITKGREICGIEWNRLGLFKDCSMSRMSRFVGPSAGAMLIRKSLFLKVGGFNQNLFMWGEDALFALELQSRNETTRLIRLGLQHIGGHSLSDLADRKSKSFLMARNRLLILRAKFPISYKIIYLPTVMLSMVANLLFRKIPQRTAAAYLEGMSVGLWSNLDTFFPNQQNKSGS
jgi:GT2 family glycosyltransferase